MAATVLHQFVYSHFNDKARWALAFKNVACERVSYLPGPHMPAICRLSGQPQTPVLCWRGRTIAGSGAIIDALERDVPEPALYPAAAADREAALALQARYDETFGPAVRTALFGVLIDLPDYLCTMFAEGKTPLKRLAYRATYPLARPLMARGNGVSETGVAKALDSVPRELDDIARRVEATGYLVGEGFSVADLCAAALMAPLSDPPCPDMQRPVPMPSALESFTARWREHPAVAWMHRMYRDHRPLEPGSLVFADVGQASDTAAQA